MEGDGMDSEKEEWRALLNQESGNLTTKGRNRLEELVKKYGSKPDQETGGTGADTSA